MLARLGGLTKEEEARVNSTIREKADERKKRGLYDDEEILKVSSAALEIPSTHGTLGKSLIGYLRECHSKASVDERRPIISHRKLIGHLIVQWKIFLRRILRFETLEPWEKQAGFNRAALKFDRDVLKELGMQHEDLEKLKKEIENIRLQRVETRGETGKGDKD